MAATVKLDPNELVSVVWSQTGEKVTLPRRLITTGNKAAQERYLVGSGQIAAEDAPALPVLQEPQEIQQAVIDAAALQQVEARLQRLERQPAPILPSEASLAQWAMAAQRIGTSHQELAATQEQTIQAVEATAAAAEQRLGELDSKQAALASTISDALSSAQEATAQAVLSMEQTSAAALTTIEERALATAAEIAAQQIGPTGAAGSSTVLALEDPLEIDSDNFAQRWLGRGLIDGDGVLVIRPDQILVRRWVGGTWREGPAIQPKVVREDVKVSHLDASTKVYPTVSSAAGGGTGGSGLADPLTVSIIPKGGSVAVADSSRWQAGGYGIFTSGIIHLEFIPNQGIMGGRHHFVTASFVLLAGVPDTFQMTEFSVLGGGFNGSPAIFDVSIDGSIGAATAPSSLGIALPAGTANATRLFVTITAADPATRDFTIKGNVIWTPEAATSTQLPNLPVRKQPAWLLVS
jgi:hypothetical protein